MGFEGVRSNPHFDLQMILQARSYRVFRRGVTYISMYGYRTRGVWGYAPPGNFAKLDPLDLRLRSFLRLFWNHSRYMCRTLPHPVLAVSYPCMHSHWLNSGAYLRFWKSEGNNTRARSVWWNFNVTHHVVLLFCTLYLALTLLCEQKSITAVVVSLVFS